MFVGSSTSKLRVSGHDDVGDPVFLEVLTHELGFGVLVDEDDDLRVEFPVSSVLNEGTSKFEENVGFPVSSGPGDFGDCEVVRESMEVGSDETSGFRVTLLDVVGEGFGDGGGGEDEVRRSDAFEEGIENGFGVVDEVGVWKVRNEEEGSGKSVLEERESRRRERKDERKDASRSRAKDSLRTISASSIAIHSTLSSPIYTFFGSTGGGILLPEGAGVSQDGLFDGSNPLSINPSSSNLLFSSKFSAHVNLLSGTQGSFFPS